MRLDQGIHKTSAGAFDRPKLGRYTIEEEVGAGGMSVVYAALDHDLDRRVALKVMRHDVGSEDDRLRIRGEARALAGLNHPNIVPVYDVGHVDDGRLYMSMELVRGRDLSAWLAESSPSKADILAVLHAAGRGLAAAHAVGLVHCDVKPSNILVGDDGRVRVVDFGIARPTAEPVHNGTAFGTPHYMSPEQARGGTLDPKSDQFSFCLMAFEALFDRSPVSAKTEPNQLDEVEAGEFGVTPRRPVWSTQVHNALTRGLHVDPAQRWPTMLALLAAISPPPTSRRWTQTLVPLAIAGGAAAMAPLVTGEHRCESDRAPHIWAERRDGVRDAFEATGIPNSRAEFARLEQRLSRFTDSWTTAQARLCSSDVVDASERTRQQACLQHALDQFDLLVAAFEQASVKTVQNADVAVDALPDLSNCGDAPPPDVGSASLPPADRDRIEALTRELETTPMLTALHRNAHAERLTSDAVETAEAIGYAPLLANALHRRADVLASQGQWVDAAAVYERGFHLAETTRLDALAAEIATDLLLAYGYKLSQPSRAERWVKVARAAVTRLGPDATSLRAEFIRTQGLVALRRSDYAQALAHFERAVSVFESVEPANPRATAEAFSNLGIVQHELGRLDAASRSFERASALLESEVGPYDTRRITLLNNLGTLAQARGDHQTAYEHFEAVHRAETVVFGAVDIRLAMTLNNMGTALSALQRSEEAAPFYRRSIEAYESGDHHAVDLARPVGNLAVAELEAGRHASAEALLLRAIQLIESEAGPMHAELGIHWFNLATVRLEQHDPERAAAAMRRCSEIDEHAYGLNHPNIAQNRMALATIHVRAGQPQRARPLLEDAIRIHSASGASAVTVALTEFELAKLLTTMGELTDAQTHLAEARRSLKNAGPAGRAHLAGLDAWAQTHLAASP